jgi:hypothetical protein
MHKRLTLAAAAAAAGLLVVPSFASAASTCTYDPAARAVTLISPSHSPHATELITSGPTIRFADGGFGANCQGGGIVATPQNTEKITVKGSIPTGFNHFIVPAVSFGGTSEGAFEDHSEIETFVFPGTGGDFVDIKGTPGNDTIHVNNNFPAEVRWDSLFPRNVDTEVTIQSTSDTRIRVDAGDGNDTVTGQRTVLASTAGGTLALGGTLTKLTAFGGAGDDTLTGGLASGDQLFGGPGRDKLAVNDSLGGDSIDGGGEFDTGVIDKGIDSAFGIEQLSTVQVAVGRLQLTPQLPEVAAGKSAKLKLSWAHPKRWSDLRSISLQAFDGKRRVGTIALDPATSRLSATGDLELARGATLSHRGKTVTAKLGLRPASALSGKTLRLAVEATDRNGRRQLESNAGSLKVT